MPTTLNVPSAREAKETQRRKLMGTPSPELSLEPGEVMDDVSEASAES